MLTLLQEKHENLITLPESSDAVKTILLFFYSGRYEGWNKDESEGRKALHHAEVYTAAKKYQIDNLVKQASYGVRVQLNACENKLVHRDLSTEASTNIKEG